MNGLPGLCIGNRESNPIDRKHTASELRTNWWIKQNSGVCELTVYPAENITKDKLYDISRQLYKVKDALEKHPLSPCSYNLKKLASNV